MKIATAQSTNPDTLAAFEGAYAQLLQELGGAPDMLLLFMSVPYDAHALAQALPQLAPGVPVHAGTSCLGVMTGSGFASQQGVGMGLGGLRDPEGNYGVGMVTIDNDPRLSSAQAIQEAIDQAGRWSEVPEMVWLTAAPGCEEAVLDGIADVVGANVPIFGGSTADNTVEGHWKQFTPGRVEGNSVILSVFYPSSQISFAFESGYVSTGTTWEVTRSDGRVIHELDGRPAAEVYNEASGGAIAELLPGGGNILSHTTLQPLGRTVKTSSPNPTVLLSHPAEVTSDGALVLFSEIRKGERVSLMKGSNEGLVRRAAEVVDFAIALPSWDKDEIHGALVIYCAGCMLSVEPHMNAVVDGIQQSMGANNPFMGIFTFGEQGCFSDGPSRHGNLMISAAIFGG